MSKVTVLIPTYNYAKYLPEAIESILNQTYPQRDIEIIVVDDGSTDNTKEVLKPYISKGIIKYLYQDNAGKASATRLGVEIANGEYLFNLDADDYYLPNCIATVMDYFLKDNNINQVSHLAYRLEKSAELIKQKLSHLHAGEIMNGKEILKKNIFHGWNVGLGSTFAIKTSILKNASIPDEIDMYIDLYLFLLSAANKGYIVQLDSYLSVFRRHEGSYSEGIIKLESTEKRSLRYLKSAKAICDEGNKYYSDFSIKHYLKTFYFGHLWGARYYQKELGISILIKLLFHSVCTVFFYKSKLTFLKNTVRIILKS